MEIRSALLHRISKALTPALAPPLELGGGAAATAVEGGKKEAPAVKPEPLPNMGMALKTGNSSLLLSPQEKEILQALFVNQSHDLAASGFRLYSGQNPQPAMKGSFVDLRG